MFAVAPHLISAIQHHPIIMLTLNKALWHVEQIDWRKADHWPLDHNNNFSGISKSATNFT